MRLLAGIQAKSDISEVPDEVRKELAARSMHFAAVDAAWLLQEQRRVYELTVQTKM
jgi:hypothetical protein